MRRQRGRLGQEQQGGEDCSKGGWDKGGWDERGGSTGGGAVRTRRLLRGGEREGKAIEALYI